MFNGATQPNVYMPRGAGVDWNTVFGDVRMPLVVTNNREHARRLCSQGQPTIAVSGMTQRAVRRWLQRRGANVVGKVSAH